MPHSPLRLESELDQAHARLHELAAGFARELADRPVSEATLLFATAQLCGTLRTIAERFLTRDEENCTCHGCIGLEASNFYNEFLATHPSAPLELSQAFQEFVEKTQKVTAEEESN
jgi:hypothetical protein